MNVKPLNQQRCGIHLEEVHYSFKESNRQTTYPKRTHVGPETSRSTNLTINLFPRLTAEITKLGYAGPNHLTQFLVREVNLNGHTFIFKGVRLRFCHLTPVAFLGAGFSQVFIRSLFDILFRPFSAFWEQVIFQEPFEAQCRINRIILLNDLMQMNHFNSHQTTKNVLCYIWHPINELSN